MRVSVSYYLPHFSQFCTDFFSKFSTICFSTKPYTNRCRTNVRKKFIIVITRTCNINDFHKHWTDASKRIIFSVFPQYLFGSSSFQTEFFSKDSIFDFLQNDIHTDGYHINRNKQNSDYCNTTNIQHQQLSKAGNTVLLHLCVLVWVIQKKKNTSPFGYLSVSGDVLGHFR